MSKSLNKVILIGNLGADPEVRSTTGGGRVATLSLATGRQWKDASGAKQEKTAWHRLIAWNSKNGQQLADICERYCKKGDKLYIEGEIDYRSWDDKDGTKRYTTEITVRELIMLSGKGEGESGGSSGGSWSGRSAAAAPAKSGAAKKDDSFDDVPDALDAEDDDLPF
jgi:single-strand DNA-binding protein